MASFIVLLPAVGLVLLVLLRTFTNWRSLNKAPGPFLAGTTDLWRAYYQYNGQLRQKLLALHRQHGPIVRYGVNSVSIADPEVINVVYGSRAGFVTAESYNVLVGIQNGKQVPSLVSTRDEARHAALRRAVANAFTPVAVLGYEGSIDETIADLLAVLGRKSETGMVFDLAATMLYASVDAAGRFAFGETMGCLAAEADVGGSIQLIRNRFVHWGLWSSLPGLERLVYRNWFAMRLSRMQKRAPSSSSMVAVAVAKLTKARDSAKGEVGSSKNLLGGFLEASKDHPKALDTSGIIGMLMSTISGAGDTTSTTVTAILYLLMRNPSTLQRLEQELSSADLCSSSSSQIPTFSQVKNLPYLHAVIREGMRLFSTPTFPIERTVPSGGATVAGMSFPAGATVGCLPAAIHANKSVYGDDPDIFRPERWLEEENKEALRRMEASHMGFSRGRRVCLGQHIAVLQMKKVIPAVVMKFRVSNICLLLSYFLFFRLCVH